MPDIFLIAPPDAAPATFLKRLNAVLETVDAKALLLPRGNRGESEYKALVKAVAPAAQDRDIAVLIEGDPGEVRKLGADGLHVTGDIEDVRDAVDALKPEFIVGAAAISGTDDAMGKGELEVDYVFFGPLSGSIDAPTRELARWWAETMEVPSVLSDPGAGPSGWDAEGCEFIALGEAVFAETPA